MIRPEFFQLTPNLKFMREMTCYETIKQHKAQTNLYIKLMWGSKLSGVDMTYLSYQIYRRNW